MSAGAPRRSLSASLRAAWREVMGLDDVDEDALLFTHHRRTARHAAELLVLSALLALCVLVPMEPHFGEIFGFPIPRRFTIEAIFDEYLDAREWSVPFAALGWAGVLLALRVIRRPPLLAAALLLWPVAAWTAWLSVRSVPLWEEVTAAWPAETLRIAIPVSTCSLGLPTFAMPVVAVAGGLYAARRGYTHARWFAGSASAVLAFAILLHRGAASLADAPGAAAFLLLMLFAFLFVRLPLQRRALEDAFGFDLTNADGRAWRRLGFADAAALHALLAGILVVVLSAVAVCELPRAWQRSYERRPWHAPDLVNAQDAMGRLFVRSEDASTFPYPAAARDPDLLLLKQLGARVGPKAGAWTPPDLVARAAALLPPQARDAAFAPYEPWMTALVAGSKADYWDPLGLPEGDEPDVGAALATTSLLCARSVLRARDGDVDGALADVQAVLRTGLLLHEMDRHLYQSGSGSRMLSSATDAAWTCHALWAENPEALAALAGMLDSHHRRATAPTDWDALLRNEMPFRRVAFAFDLMYPDIGRMRASHERHPMWYDSLRLAIAMDRFRLARGTWPSSADDLVPEFLAEIPREHVLGTRYSLQPSASGARPTIMRGRQPMLAIPGGPQDPGNPALAAILDAREGKTPTPPRPNRQTQRR